jgi:hypothetical protein
MSFLLIQNPGIAPAEAFTLLGASMSRETTQSGGGTIGMFGSGTKMSINYCLRQNIRLIIYTGRLCLSFKMKDKVMADELDSKTFKAVLCEMSGKTPDGKSVNKTVDLNWVAEYGAADWDDPWMVLREFTANAFDRTFREFNAYEHDDLEVRVVEDNQVRAKDGLTRVFIEMTPEMGEAERTLKSRFLHFSRPHRVNTLKFIRTDEPGGPTVYKNGVFVRKVASGRTALRSYNFHDELRLDESRNVDDYRVREAAARSWANADKHDLLDLFLGLQKHPDCWEATALESLYAKVCYADDEEKAAENWRETFTNAYGPRAVACPSESFMIDMVTRRGYEPIVFTENFCQIFHENGCPTWRSILNEHEQKGLEVTEASPTAKLAVDFAWEVLTLTKLDGDKPKPVVKSFRKLIPENSITFGFYDPKTNEVLVNIEHAADGPPSPEVLMTMVEECVHYSTGYRDYTREFQNALFTIIVRLAQTKGMTV